MKTRIGGIENNGCDDIGAMFDNNFMLIVSLFYLWDYKLDLHIARLTVQTNKAHREWMDGNNSGIHEDCTNYTYEIHALNGAEKIQK